MFLITITLCGTDGYEATQLGCFDFCGCIDAGVLEQDPLLIPTWESDALVFWKRRG